MKAMLSQPMAGKTEEEIVATRERAIMALDGMGYEVVDTLFTDEWHAPENMKERGVENIPLCFLAKSLENMSKCHAAYFCKGWEKARGCRVEHEAAKAYGLEILYEDAAQEQPEPVARPYIGVKRVKAIMKDVIIPEHVYPCRSYCLKRLGREDLLTWEWLEDSFPNLLQKYKDDIELMRGDILVWIDYNAESHFFPVRIHNDRVLFEKIAYDYHCCIYEGGGLVSDVILEKALPLIIRERKLERLSRPDYYLRLESKQAERQTNIST